MLQCDMISAIQAVTGVVYLDTDIFSAVDEQNVSRLANYINDPRTRNQSVISVDKSQICFLSPDIPDALILEQIP